MEKLDITALQDAFTSLEKTLSKLEDLQWFNQQEEIVQDTLIAGSIQKFEFVYELSIKMLKRQLKTIESNDSDIDSSDFRDILRMSAQAGLIESPESWFDYRKMRNITSHTYDQNKALQVYNGIAAFLESTRFLVTQLQKRNAND